jgi:hypothetical protein
VLHLRGVVAQQGMLLLRGNVLAQNGGDGSEGM